MTATNYLSNQQLTIVEDKTRIVNELAQKLMSEIANESAEFKQQLAMELVFRQTCQTLDLMPKRDRLVLIVNLIQHYGTEAD